MEECQNFYLKDSKFIVCIPAGLYGFARMEYVLSLYVDHPVYHSDNICIDPATQVLIIRR